MKFKEIKIESNQNVYDVAIQEYGSGNYLYKLLKDNPSIDLSTDLVPGTTINIDIEFEVVDKATRNALLNDNVKVATSTPMIAFGFVWSDLEAEAYWDLMTVANGDVEIDAFVLYGKEQDELKQHIDNWVVQLKGDGLWVKGLDLAVFLGGTAATIAVKIISTGFDMTFFASPSHGPGGTLLDGLTQYISMNNDPSSDAPAYSIAIGQYADVTGSIASLGSREVSANSTFLSYNDSTSVAGSLNGVQKTAALSPNLSLVHMVTRTTSSDLRIYIDGALHDSSSTVAVSPHSNIPTLLGAWTNISGPIQFTEGEIKTGFVFKGLTEVESQLLTTRIKEFNLFLGR